MKAWLRYSLDYSRLDYYTARSVLRYLMAIEFGDADFNKNALLPEETFVELYDSIRNGDDLGEDDTVRWNPVLSLDESPDLEWAYWMMAGTCVTFLLFDQETKESMPIIFEYASHHWGGHSEDIWQRHAHGFYGTHCRNYIDETDLLELTVRFLSDKSKFGASLKVAHESSRDIDYSVIGNLTALHFAARYDLDKVTSVLLQGTDIDVNARNSQGMSPLHLASTQKERESYPSYSVIIESSTTPFACSTIEICNKWNTCISISRTRWYLAISLPCISQQC